MMKYATSYVENILFKRVKKSLKYLFIFMTENKWNAFVELWY